MDDEPGDPLALRQKLGLSQLSLTPCLLVKTSPSPVFKKFFQRSNSSLPKGPLGLRVLGQDTR